MIRSDIFIEDQPPQISIRVEKDKYLGRLSEADRRNFTRIEQLFKQAMEEKGRRGALFAVGGSITKQPSRKDIDLLVVFEPNPDDFKSAEHLTRYRRALVNFRLLHDIVKIIIREDPEFKIQKIIEPAIDEEFESESILKHDGSITLQAKTGMPIEFIRSNSRRVSEAIKEMKEPYVVITTITEDYG